MDQNCDRTRDRTSAIIQMTKWIKNQKFRKHVSREAIQVKLGSPDQLESGLQVRSNLESIFQTEFSPLKEIILKWKYLLTSRIYFITVKMRNQTMFAHSCSFTRSERPLCLSVGFRPIFENSHTGGCLFSREKALKDVKSRVRFCFLVGVILDLDWPRKNWPMKI